MTKGNEKKAGQLGMSYGAACGKLRKMLLFQMAQQLGKDVCIRCNEAIESYHDFSIDHKIHWLDNDPELFWNLDNIGFAHLICNIRASRSPMGAKHSLHRYKMGCRRDVCKGYNAVDKRRWRNRKASDI